MVSLWQRLKKDPFLFQHECVPVYEVFYTYRNTETHIDLLDSWTRLDLKLNKLG